MLQQDQPDDYVVATGEQFTVRDFADAAFACLGLNYRDYIVVDPKFLRPTDVDTLMGDATKAKKTLGWCRKATFHELVQEMVEADLRLLSDSRR